MDNENSEQRELRTTRTPNNENSEGEQTIKNGQSRDTGNINKCERKLKGQSRIDNLETQAT